MSEPEQFYVNLGNEISQRRRMMGWTQTDLADRSGMVQSVISDIESGKRRITLWTLRRLAMALNTTAADILEMAEIDV